MRNIDLNEVFFPGHRLDATRRTGPGLPISHNRKVDTCYHASEYMEVLPLVIAFIDGCQARDVARATNLH